MIFHHVKKILFHVAEHVQSVKRHFKQKEALECIAVENPKHHNVIVTKKSLAELQSLKQIGKEGQLLKRQKFQTPISPHGKATLLKGPTLVLLQKQSF